MAWTLPVKTWVTGDLLSAATVNIEWRDRFLEVAKSALAETVSGAWIFTNSPRIEHNGALLIMRSTAAAANEGLWYIQALNPGFRIGAANDDLSGQNDALQFTRSGPTVTALTIGPAFVLSNAQRLTGVISPPQLTADVNNYNPTNLSIARIIRIDASGGDGSHFLTGLAAQPAGTVISIVVTAGDLQIPLESGSSSAANRFGFTTGLNPSGVAGMTIWYDGASSRWRVLG